MWLLGLAAAGAFFFAYGIIEELIKKKREPSAESESVQPAAMERELLPIPKPVTNEPVVRGFDSGELFREDSLIRIEELSKDIAKEQRK